MYGTHPLGIQTHDGAMGYREIHGLATTISGETAALLLRRSAREELTESSDRAG